MQATPIANTGAPKHERACSGSKKPASEAKKADTGRSSRERLLGNNDESEHEARQVKTARPT